ncbi:hypothetical protein QYF36_026856 [Acer negundo]|nr:hypothetical protein QYF36_026856 [Acer negundo]
MTWQNISKSRPNPGFNLFRDSILFRISPKQPFRSLPLNRKKKPTHSLLHTHKTKANFISRRNPNLAKLGFVMKGGRSRADDRGTDSKLKSKSSGASKKKAPAKDPNKPKRPASAFFVFMEEFRQQYKKEHPNNKSVAAVGKAGGEKWKSLSTSEKAPFVERAEKRKKEYEKTMQAYNKKLAGGNNQGEEDESDKSKSEVNDEDDDEEGSEEEDDDE